MRPSPPRRLLVGLSLLAALAGRAPLAAAQLQVVSDDVIELRGQPGEQLRGTITLRNTGVVPQDARVYLTDYAFFADGRTLYDRPGSSARSNAAWVTVSPTQVRLAPGQAATVAYTVNVPRAGGTPLVGTYWSVVMIEGMALPAATPSPASARRARVQLGMQVAIRHGVQLATDVAPASAQTRVQLVRPAVHATARGGRQLAVEVANGGELAVRPLLRVELYDEQGRRVRAEQQQRGLIYPGSSVLQQFELGALPAGTYRALVVADAGGDELFAARFTLKL